MLTMGIITSVSLPGSSPERKLFKQDIWPVPPQAGHRS